MKKNLSRDQARNAEIVGADVVLQAKTHGNLQAAVLSSSLKMYLTVVGSEAIMAAHVVVETALARQEMLVKVLQETRVEYVCVRALSASAFKQECA